MKLRMWGTRGSLPRVLTHDGFVGLVDTYAKKAEKAGLTTIGEFRNALRDGDLGHPLTYGGHTSCSEIVHKNRRFFVDMGTGLADASAEVMAQGRTEFIIFLSHMHWDHIMGLPFFVPLYIAGTKLTIYHVHPQAPEAVKIQFNGVNFPVSWDKLAAQVEFRQVKLYETLTFEELKVSTVALDHPGGSFGFRFEAEGRSLLIGVDGEYKRTSREALGKDLAGYQNLDLLVFDGQYELDELASRYDWGHSSPPIGVDLALREGIRHLIITHHDPRATEAKSERMLLHAQQHCGQTLPAYQELWNALGQPQGPHIQLAYDGFECDLTQFPLRSRPPA